jgi:hypothetical protein
LTLTIANIHGMLVYDTLFGNDDKAAKPQMVEPLTADPHLHTCAMGSNSDSSR